MKSNIETGVQEFARILELSDDEAKRIYDLIGQHQNNVQKQAVIDSELSNFAIRWNSSDKIDKLQYIQSHFISDLGQSWKKRIRVLKGEADEYTEYLNKLIEEQHLNDKVKRLETVLNEQIKLLVNHGLETDAKNLESELSEIIESKPSKLPS